MGIGAQKAGTSWWNALIEAHPDVVPGGGPAQGAPLLRRAVGQALVRRGRDPLRALLPAARGAITGEWTPGYMIDFWTPGLIARGAPSAHPGAAARPGRPVPERPDATRWPPRASTRHRDIAGAFQRGLYAQQLRRVLDAFPREQVLPPQYEACREDPARELARTFAFLGLAPPSRPPAAFRREVNPTTARKVELTAGLAAALLQGYGIDLEQLSDLAPDLDLARWPTARELGLA